MSKHYTYGVVHGLAQCRDCGWETDSYKNAQALAAQHAKCYGHHVTGELGIAFSYTGAPLAHRNPTIRRAREISTLETEGGQNAGMEQQG